MATSEATAAAAAAAEHGSGGLPQFDPSWWPGQMVWMLIIFGVMFFLVAKVFVPKVGGAMDDREDHSGALIAGWCAARTSGVRGTSAPATARITGQA